VNLTGLQIQARLGEVSLMAAATIADGGSQKYYAEAVKRFCRSIELCDDYLRGYYGLKLVRPCGYPPMQALRLIHLA
jgi:hypothetical protein